MIDPTQSIIDGAFEPFAFQKDAARFGCDVNYPLSPSEKEKLISEFMRLVIKRLPQGTQVDESSIQSAVSAKIEERCVSVIPKRTSDIHDLSIEDFNFSGVWDYLKKFF